jgi:uncharacterized repeat protein (TIGR03803 family)
MLPSRKFSASWTAALVILLGYMLAANPYAVAQEKVLHNFNPSNEDGLGPCYNGSLVFDSAGNLYGTTNAGGAHDFGTVFELTPRAGGGWTEEVLYSFNLDGADAVYPEGDLIIDSAGNLYGTANGGVYGDGTVFELIHGSTGGWTETVLHSFSPNGGDGQSPRASLILDAAGSLYGTTQYGGAGGGTVFELTPTEQGWTETILHNFGSGADGAWPYSSLIFDSGGNLYGTTWRGGVYGAGTVFELTPDLSGGWTEMILHDFGKSVDGASPYSGLILDAAGNLYGTAYYGGTYDGGMVFELTPTARGSWMEKLLHNFNNSNGKDGYQPYAGLIFDTKGNLYGTTLYGGSGACNDGIFGSGCGTVFELMPQAGGHWTETILHDFNYDGRDGIFPYSTLTLNSVGNLLGTTYLGGGYNDGTVYEIKRP